MGLLRNWRRRRHLTQPFPAAWEETLLRDVNFYKQLTSSERESLCRHIRVFLAEKNFEGCDGLTITDRIRVVVAAYACLLVLNIKSDIYPLLGSILIYPTSFAVQVSAADESGIVTEAREERLGESWEAGTVVLSWDSILEVIEGRHRGLNVILHEFAHQLDAEDGITDGAPLCHLHDRYRDWAEVCSATYIEMRNKQRRGRPLVLDRYGASSPAEFFAVATETFFEQPNRLKAHHADLYAELEALYRQDPARDENTGLSGRDP